MMKNILKSLVVLTSMVLAPNNINEVGATSPQPLEIDNNTETVQLVENPYVDVIISTVEEYKDVLIEDAKLEEIVAPIVVNKYTYYKVNTSLNKRKTPDTKYNPIGYLEANEPVAVENILTNNWALLSDGTYVNSKYITKTEMTRDEFIKVRDEFQIGKKARQAERIKQAQIKKVAEEVRQKEQAPTSSKGRNGITLTSGEVDLMARLVRAEAGGESYEGMVAVASVVLNRVVSSKFPNTVNGVIYARNQFSPVANGSINKPASDIHIKAVKDALTRDNTNGALFFYAPNLVKSTYMESLQTVAVIGVHHFKVN